MIWCRDWFTAPCIDLREADEFLAEHLAGSTSLPLSRLPKAMHELPDKHQPLKLLGTDDQLNSATDFLIDKGYVVEAVYALDEHFWRWARSEKITEPGCATIPLWRANPLLENQVEQIEELTSGRTALDLACGAGRDSVFLAQRGWQLTAVDANEDALSRCQQLAANSDCDLTTLCLDLEETLPPMENPKVDLIVVMRYLHRPLLPYLAEWLNPGGILCYSTFMVGCEKFGSPKNPNYLLKPGELADTFADLTIVHDKPVKLPDGRPVAQFIAQKKR